jgi:uncharacterized membrane protein
MILKRGILLLGIVAILSIALNLFLAGNQLGRQFRQPVPPPNFEQRLHNLSRDMSEADQTIAQEVLDRHHGDIAEKWRAYRPAAQRVIAAMRADSFDPAEAKAAYENANQRWEELRLVMRDTLIEIAQKVSPEGRKHMRGLGMAP